VREIIMKEIILVQKNQLGRVKFINLFLEDNTVRRIWGLIDGKTQTTSNTYDYINKGKSNQLTPKKAAEEDYNRIIDTKIKEGYIITETLEELPNLDRNKMDFNNLPVKFCCSKPYTSISKTKLDKLIKKDSVIFHIKENGLCHFILITENSDVKIYTRRIDDHTRKYPKIVKDIKKLNYPPKTLLIVELVIDPELKIPHMEGFKLMSSISRSDTLKGKVKEDITKTLTLQEAYTVKAVVFNLLFLDGKDLTTQSYNRIFNLHLKKIADHDDIDIVLPRTISFLSYDEAYGWATTYGIEYEGAVAWLKEENAEITYNGKPNRRACYKLKAVKEDDVIAYGWKEGTGAKQGKIGSLLIGKYNDIGMIVPMGNVGSGLKIKEGDCEVENWKFPCVIEIQYDQRFKTAKYQFPRFTGKVHVEKLPSEIIVDANGF